MASKPFSLLKGRRIRGTRLDACGRFVYGDRSTVVSKGFITVGITTLTTESEGISVTNAAGEICVNEPAETTVSGHGIEAVFCDVDPELFSMFTGQEVYLDAAGNAIGFTVNTKLETVNAVALELWTGVANSDACANPDAQGAWGYLLLSFLKGGYVSDVSIENAAISFTIAGAITRDGNMWGVGPYNVILDGATPSPLPTPIDPNDSLLAIVVDVAPPLPYSGARPLLDRSIEPLTAVVGTVSGLTATFAATPADIVAPTFYDFGDGEWEYVASEDMGATSHTYDAPGTYTVLASTNGTTVQTAVTVVAP